MYDHSITNFGIIELCLVFSKNPRVDSLDRFIKSVVDKVKLDMCNFKNEIILNNIFKNIICKLIYYKHAIG